MLKINKELSQKIINLKKLKDYIALFIDYKKESEYSNLLQEVTNDIQLINGNFSPKDIDSIINIVEAPQIYYLYDTDDIVETLFPEGSKKNNYIKSAYYWIDLKKRIEWIINCVLEVPSNKKYYDKVDNVNNNYIISSIKLDCNF